MPRVGEWIFALARAAEPARRTRFARLAAADADRVLAASPGGAVVVALAARAHLLLRVAEEREHAAVAVGVAADGAASGGVAKEARGTTIELGLAIRDALDAVARLAVANARRLRDPRTPRPTCRRWGSPPRGRPRLHPPGARVLVDELVVVHPAGHCEQGEAGRAKQPRNRDAPDP